MTCRYVKEEMYAKHPHTVSTKTERKKYERQVGWI
jgi:hypothetical protein